MSRAAISELVEAIYLFVLGAILVITPNTLLSIFGFAPTSEVWIRILGLTTIIIGYLSLTAARTEAVALFRAGIVTRLFLLAGFIVLVAMHWAPTTLLLFGLVEAAMAAWTWWALRNPSK